MRKLLIRLTVYCMVYSIIFVQFKTSFIAYALSMSDYTPDDFANELIVPNDVTDDSKDETIVRIVDTFQDNIVEDYPDDLQVKTTETINGVIVIVDDDTDELKEALEGTPPIIEEEIPLPEFTTDVILEPDLYTVEHIEVMLDDTALSGLAESVIYVYDTYSINPTFVIGVMAHESGNGTSGLATSNNNLFGMKAPSGNWMSFESQGECVEYFGDMLTRLYVSQGLDTISEINGKYAADPGWSAKVQGIMERYYNKYPQS